MGRSVDILLKTEMHFVCGCPGNKGFIGSHILNEVFWNLVLSACEWVNIMINSLKNTGNLKSHNIRC